jgi:hypothetical protein
MENTEDFEKFLKTKEFKKHKKDFKLSDVKTALDHFIGEKIHTVKSFKNGRLDVFNSDYSESEHINTGKVTLRGILASTIYSGISLNTGIFGNTKPLLEFSHENMVKTLNTFNDAATQTTEYQEIMQFMSETFFSSPNLTAYAFQIAIAAGTLATGLYVKNGLKKNFEIENICENIDKKVKHKNFSLKHASEVFQVLDNFYEYRRMVALGGKETKNFIKNITAPVLYGLKHNISHPILNKVRDIVGDDICKKVTNGLKTITPDFVESFFKKNKTITASDMIIYIDKEIRKSILNEHSNNPVKLNVQDEISKIGKDVYETMLLTQTRRALILSSKDYIISQKKIQKLEENPSFLNNLKIKKEIKKSEKELDIIKSIENLSTLDKKEGRLSRFTVVSLAANKIINKFENLTGEKLKQTSTDSRDISKNINKFIYNEENDIKDMYLSTNNDNNYYIQDVEKMLIPKTYSFERIFKQKVDEMIVDKTNEIEQKRLQTRNKIS